MTGATASAAVFALAFAAQAHAEPAAQIRFCPEAQLRPYPLDDTGRMQGLLLQSFAVVNRGVKAVDVNVIHLELLNADAVVDRRTLGVGEVRRWADESSGLQGALQAAPSQFCGTRMIEPGVKLGGPLLAPNEALMVIRQVFAFDRARDALRVRVEASADGSPVQASATIPIRMGFSRTALSFPLRGTSYVGWAASFHTGHRLSPAGEFGLDIAKLGGAGLTYRATGLKLEDYFAYGAEVLAAADGTVVTVVSDQPEDPAKLRQPGESLQAYAARHSKEAEDLFGAGDKAVSGNHVVLEHGDGEYSFYAHLQPRDIRVRKGQRVKAGAVLGRLGSSGNSTEPHLHFHVCDGPEPLACAGIPARFTNVTLLWADIPRALQSGDIVTTK